MSYKPEHHICSSTYVVIELLRLQWVECVPSRVRGSVTNNNGVWIGWLDLLTFLLQSLLITMNLQQRTINLQPNPWMPRTRSILLFLLRLTAPTTAISLGIPRYIDSGRTSRKTLVKCEECVFIGPLTSTGHCADHTENTPSVVRMRVYWPVAWHWAWRGLYRKHFF
jgi:hypothetical protein